MWVARRPASSGSSGRISAGSTGPPPRTRSTWCWGSPGWTQARRSSCHSSSWGAVWLASTLRAGTPAGGAAESHAGDLGNISVGEDGTGTLEVTTDRVTLETDAKPALVDNDGSALVIHQNPDDLQTDPSGESGPRIACGVIFAGLEATPVAIGQQG